MTHMCKHHENHGKSSHCINIFYSLFCHFACKNTENSWNSCVFRQKILLLHHERANQLDRLGKSILYDGGSILPPTSAGRYVLSAIFSLSYPIHVLFCFRLSQEQESFNEGVCQEIWICPPNTLSYI